MSERHVPVVEVPEGTRCALCGHVNGDLTYSYANGVRVGEGHPFVQAFYVREEGTEREMWAHEGCLAQHAYDRYEAWRDSRELAL